MAGGSSIWIERADAMNVRISIESTLSLMAEGGA